MTERTVVNFLNRTSRRCVYCSVMFKPMSNAMFSRSAAVALSAALAFAVTGFAQNAPAPAPTPTPAPAAAPAPAATAAPAPKVEDQATFTIVGVTVRTNNAKEAGGQGAIPQLWMGVMQNGSLEQIPNKAGEELFVVYSDYASDSTGDYNYTLGYKVTAADKIPDGMVARTVTAGKYAVVTSDQGAPQEVVPALWQRINTMTPQQMGGTRAFHTDYESYGTITDFSSMQVTAHLGLK